MARWLVLGVVALLSINCGSDSTQSPIAPTPPPVATPPPQPTPPTQTIPTISGTWAGSFELQVQGQRLVTEVSLSLQQTTDSITGTWTQVRPPNAPPSYQPWNGTITGTQRADASFVGQATIRAETDTGTGACIGTFGLSGTSSESQLRWTGPNVLFTNCENIVGGFVWIVSR